MHYFYKIFNFILLLNKILKYKITEVKKVKPNHNLDANLVVSLTAKKERFGLLHLTINSIFNQTILPNEIILWIEKKDKIYLSNKINVYKKKGLKIMYCKNLKSYNKIIHTLNLKKKNYIITFDDDIIYNSKSIEYLVKKSKRNKKNIIANRIHKIKLDKKNFPLPYKSWIWNSTNFKANKLNFQTGVYGVLYPPNSFFKDVTNEKLFTKLSPYADDIWLYWMIRLNKKFVKWSKFRGKNLEIINFGDNKMRDYNISNFGNDEQIKKLISFYGFPK